jgi:hypothetical protein
MYFNHIFDSNISEYRSILIELFESEANTVKKVSSNNPPKESCIEGVYMINTPDDKEIVYIEKTLLKKINGRIQDHRKVNHGSNLNFFLKIFTNYSKDIGNYLVRCIEIKDIKIRGLFEDFAISIVRPDFNKVEG